MATGIKRSEMTCDNCLYGYHDPNKPGITCRVLPDETTKYADNWCGQGAWRGHFIMAGTGECYSDVVLWTDIGAIEEDF